MSKYLTILFPLKWSVIIVILVVSSNLSFCNVKDYDKYSSNPKLVLKNLTIKKNYRLVVGNVNINSISNKFANLNVIIQGKDDVLVIAETKTDLTH